MRTAYAATSITIRSCRAGALPGPDSRAQPVGRRIYRGKTINMIIGYPTAGANDHYARTVGRHIGK